MKDVGTSSLLLQYSGSHNRRVLPGHRASARTIGTGAKMADSQRPAFRERLLPQLRQALEQRYCRVRVTVCALKLGGWPALPLQAIGLRASRRTLEQIVPPGVFERRDVDGYFHDEYGSAWSYDESSEHVYQLIDIEPPEVPRTAPHWPLEWVQYAVDEALARMRAPRRRTF